jgi:replicative DNA helicase
MIDQFNIEAEQSVLGALLRFNDAFDRIPHLEAQHFYRGDHRAIFSAMLEDFAAGRPFDLFTVLAKVGDQVQDGMRYLNQMQQTMPSAATIERHANAVREKFVKRSMAALGVELEELSHSHEESAVCVDLAASKLELLAERRSKFEPVRVSDTISDYLALIEQRMNRDASVMPIATGYQHLDDQLDGGLERGTLTVIGGRPGTGKTAAALGIARHVAIDGLAYVQSMEMSKNQLNERNIAALGRVPIKWLKNPQEGPTDKEYWDGMTAGVAAASKLNLFVDDQPGVTLMELRAKARKIKRQNGGKLDLIAVDQLSFLTGARSDKLHEAMGEYTRGLIAIAKELDCAVILLVQLNRDCEKRNDKRPIMSDIGVSGYIEQDAANIIFLYRDELWHPDTTQDKGICEWICVKQRQGAPGTVGLEYIGDQTRFANPPYRWHRKPVTPPAKGKVLRGGFD